MTLACVFLHHFHEWNELRLFLSTAETFYHCGIFKPTSGVHAVQFSHSVFLFNRFFPCHLESLSFLIFPWTTYLNFQSYSHFSFSVTSPLSQGCNIAQLQGDNSQVLYINNVPWSCVTWQPSSDLPRQSLGRTCCLSIYLSIVYLSIYLSVYLSIDIYLLSIIISSLGLL